MSRQMISSKPTNEIKYIISELLKTVSDFTDIGLHIMSSGEQIALCYNIKTSSLNRKHEQYLFINDGYSNELQ